MKWQKGVGRKECIIHSPKWQENIWSNIKKLIPLQGEGREKKKKKRFRRDLVLNALGDPNVHPVSRDVICPRLQRMAAAQHRNSEVDQNQKSFPGPYS